MTLFFLQILALFQISLLPGLLLLKLTGIRAGFLLGAVFAFAWGMLLNYLFVFLSVCAGTFSRENLFLFLAAEVILCLILYRKEIFLLRRIRPLEFCAGRIRNLCRTFLERSQELTGGGRIFYQLSFAAALLTLAVQLSGFLSSFGTIFELWDSALSWNRWAMEWFQGRFPTHVFEYPQLVPCAWAAGYQVIGEGIQFIPKFLMGIYPLLIGILLFDLGMRRKSTAYLAALPVCAWLFRNVEFASYGGELDLLVAFLGVGAFYCILRAEEARSAGKASTWIFGMMLFLCTALCAKQSGLYLFLVLPAAAVLILRNQPYFTLRRVLLLVLFYLLLASVTAGPYAVFAKIRILKGEERSKTEFVTEGIYSGRSKPERFCIAAKMYASRLLCGIKGVPGARWTHVDLSGGVFRGLIRFYGIHLPVLIAAGILIVLFLGYAVQSREMRWIALLIVIPYTLVWSLFFCYDLRNLALALPFTAVLFGYGFDRLAGYPVSWTRISLPYFLIPVLILCGLCALSVNDFLIRRMHQECRLKIGDPLLNRSLSEYFKTNPRKKIATDYEYLSLLPEFGNLLHYVEFSGRRKQDAEEYARLYSEPEVGYILLPDYAMPEALDDIARRMQNGTAQWIFTAGEYRFLKITGERK